MIFGAAGALHYHHQQLSTAAVHGVGLSVYSPFVTLLFTGLPRTQHPQQSIDTVHTHWIHSTDCSVHWPTGVSHADWWISLNSWCDRLKVMVTTEPETTCWHMRREMRTGGDASHNRRSLYAAEHTRTCYRPTTLPKDYAYRRPAQGGWLQWPRLCVALGWLTHRRPVSAAACCAAAALDSSALVDPPHL